MGKLEKLIVLAVLFAAAVVLAVSLSRGKDEVEAADPLSGARTLLNEEAGLDAPILEDPMSGTSAVPAGLQPEQGTSALVPSAEKAPSLLLHAGSERGDSERAGSQLEPSAAPKSDVVAGLTSSLRVEPQSDTSQPILLERQGLRPSFMDEYMLYTVVEGDTWASLAQRFYQDGRFTRNLHLANEDLSELVPGKDILVPVFDLLALDSDAEVAGELVPTSTQPAGAPLTAQPADLAPSKPVATPKESRASSPGALVYEVRAGDTLSDISLAALGTATRWKELLELNGELLKKPEDLRVGMKLQLPAGAKTPTLAKPEAKKPQPQAKTAPTKTAQTEKAAKPAAATSAKKRKVL